MIGNILDIFNVYILFLFFFDIIADVYAKEDYLLWYNKAFSVSANIYWINWMQRLKRNTSTLCETRINLVYRWRLETAKIKYRSRLPYHSFYSPNMPLYYRHLYRFSRNFFNNEKLVTLTSRKIYLWEFIAGRRQRVLWKRNHGLARMAKNRKACIHYSMEC